MPHQPNANGGLVSLASNGQTFEKKDPLEKIRTEWQTQHLFSLSHSAYVLVEALKKLLSSKSNQKQLTEELKADIRRFLKNEVDDCVLWLLLHITVEEMTVDDLNNGSNQVEGSYDVCLVLNRILVQTSPFQSFESQKTSYVTWNCTSPEGTEPHPAKSKLPRKISPFRNAVDRSLHTTVSFMIQNGLQFLEVQKNMTSGERSFRGVEAGNGTTRGDPKTLLVSILREPGQSLPSLLQTAAENFIAEQGQRRQQEQEPQQWSPELKIIDILLGFDGEGRLADSPDQTFQKAVDTCTLPVVEIFLKFKGNFRTKPNLMDALEKGDANLAKLFLHDAQDIVDEMVAQKIVKLGLWSLWTLPSVQKAATDIFKVKNTAKALLAVAVQEEQAMFVDGFLPGLRDAFDVELVEKIIKNDLQGIWRLSAVQDLKANFMGGSMLHVAVQHQKPHFVEYFLNEDRDSVLRLAVVSELEDSKSVYALWHNNNEVQNGKEAPRANSPEKETIRELLVQATIEREQKMDVLTEIFRSSKLGELSFDLSRFDSKSYSLADFLESMMADKQGSQFLSYEAILRYAEFPALDIDGRDRGDGSHQTHEEVFRVLDWLRTKPLRFVQKIVKLKVLDRCYNPHDELEIAKSLRRFQVEILDWRYLDLAISIFTPDTKARLKILHLYSSGKRAPISDWLGDQGIISFSKLRMLHIHLIQDLMTTPRCNRLRKELEAKLKIIGNASGLQFKVTSQPWNAKPTGDMRDLDEIAERAVPKLAPFIKTYREYVDNKIRDNEDFRRTRVAVIDNGVLNIPPLRMDRSNGHTGLWPRIKDGHSFFDDENRVGSWLFASDPHGTQMASLICAIDPHCDLYVAKITESRHAITPARIAKAILWAIDKEVDIISMSFAIQEEQETLQALIKNASGKAYEEGIIQFCSSHDEGLNINECWPARCDNTKVITACNEFGAIDRPTSGYHYQIHAINVAAGTVPYLESDDSISGSSVATAIAAGLASLIISCHRLKKPGFNFHKIKTSRWDLVEGTFARMRTEKNDKYLLLELFFHLDSGKTKGTEAKAVLELIKKIYPDAPLVE